ncbi:hypothetical protein Egran_03555 [Elaphomyces granulatus]|uniref:ATP-dependent RNA helicase n=1 Tax=Elaphomyces granulatus TaxID=519963 RepID=A0A232LX75_9EURO|nr:hypothetical protein Egran_03555 [Elaphomyces granulatus]
MDAFKLLTRSTKLKSLTGQSALTTSSRIPSSGEAKNPQLFRYAEDPGFLRDGNDSKKRKRGDDQSNLIEDDVLNLDFFSSPKGPSSASAPNPIASKSQRRSHGEGADDQDGSDQNESVDESHVRSLLKAHKIKVMDLRDHEAIQSVKTEKLGAKRKRRKKEEPIPVLSKKQQKAARMLFPHPLTSFQQLRKKYHISRRLLENIVEQGITIPTEVQMGSLPLLLEHYSSTGNSQSPVTPEPDLLVVAPTGSGKTLAFLIPIINKAIRHHHENPKRREILTVIVVPTKELAGQIVNEGRKLVSGTGVKITSMRKGMRLDCSDDDTNQIGKEAPLSDSVSGSDVDDEDDRADEGGNNKMHSANNSRSRNTVTKSDVLVTTPLSLINSLSNNQTKDIVPMPSVQSLVLDEADVLLDPLFREQTFGIWNACTHPKLRTSLWSATMGSNVEELAKSKIRERQQSLSISEKTPLIRVVVGLKDSAVPNVTHKLIYAATEQGKLLGLRQLLHPTAMITPLETRLRPPFLIFTKTIARATALHSELLYDIPAEAGGSSRIAVLHSDLPETHRSEIMKGFRKGEIWVIITTDLLARGVDFRGINGVVNYDIPTSSATYVHRVGRTGRAGREGGIAVTFYTQEEVPYLKSIRNLIETSQELGRK